MNKHIVVSLVFLGLVFFDINAQDANTGNIAGNFQSDFQYYMDDERIGAFAVRENMLMNSYANFTYSLNNFSAGVRYEGYMNTMLGFPNQGGINDGVGFPYRWATFNTDNIEITVGNFYEQFGSGLVLRTYEEKMLGIDNAFDGMRVRYNPIQGVYLTGLAGYQRFYWERCEGITRAFDATFQLNEIISAINESPLRIGMGGSFVSKYQRDNSPIYKLPENVGASAARLNLRYKGFSFISEYAYKINDPSAENNFIYKNGEALLLNATYSGRGLGILIETKWVDNMSFRSNRNATLTDLTLNQLPEITKNHAYAMPAYYPYATQPNGEWGIQGEVMYRIPRNTKLGGRYGTQIAVNYSRVHSIDKMPINDSIPISSPGTLGYKTDFFSIGEELYFQDFNVELTRRWTRKLYSKFIYMNVFYNFDVIRGVKDYENVKANIVVADLTYRIKPTVAIRTELQGLWTKQDMGDWVSGLLEFSIPGWFFTLANDWNYGNPDENKKVHYLNFGFGHTKGANRIHLSYGKQREGVVCIGGVCRVVPASNGLMLSISSTF